MDFESERESLSIWILPSFQARYILLFKGKTQHKLENRAGKRTAAKENETTGGERGPPRPVMNTTGWPWCFLASPCSPLLERCILCFFLVRGFCFGSSVLGLLGLFCNLSWLGLASISCFSNTWLDMRKSAIKTRTSQNKHNSRNMGVNHKIKHTNA